MGLDDLVNQAKDLAAGHETEIDGAIDSAADAVKAKTPDQVDGAVDSAADAAKGAI